MLHLLGRLPRSVKSKSTSRILTNLLKLKNLVDMGGVSFEVAIGIGNLTNDVGRDFTISGSSKIRVIFINSIT